MSGISQTVGRSMGEAAVAAARLIDKCVEDAVASLQASEPQAAMERRQQVADAWRAMMSRRRAWGERFPELLRAAFEADISGRAATDAVAPGGGGFRSLTLVDDDEIARKIESTRLAQQLTAMLERPLAELDPLMSSALGLEGIQPQRNPLRPGVYTQVLRRMMEDDRPQPAPEWTALWLRSMVQPLAKGLEQLYRAQAKLLTEAEVHAADYLLVHAPTKPAAAPEKAAAATAGPAPVTAAAAPSAAAPAASGTSAAPAPAAPTRRRIDPVRLQQFLARDEPQAHEPLDPAYYAQAEAELRALEERVDPRTYDAEAARQQMHLPVGERPARHVDTDSPLPPETWGEYGDSRERALVRGRLKTRARETGQVLGLEAVRQLLDTVADDPRLLAPVREALVALEPSLARLVMVAPRFFAEEAHPARRLLERVAERSFKYNDEFSGPFQAFLAPVTETFARLNDIEQFRTATPFQAALATLQAGWSEQDALEQDTQRKVLETVQFAERRHQQAQQLATALRERDDLLDAPAAVQEFVLATWTLVVAHARLTHAQGEDDPGGHLALLRDLLWSVSRETLKEPARAFAMIPRLLLGLREGLASLGQQPSENEAFFHQLETLHRPVLKLRATQRHRDMAPPQPPPPPAQPLAPRSFEQPWMAAEDLRAAGFEETRVPEADPPPAAPAGERLSAEDVATLSAQLQPGCWVDLHSRAQWHRARLVWATDRGTLFMFVGHGGQAHSMTRRSIERLLKDRLLRPVAADGVVPRALERLTRPSPLAA